MAERKRRRRNPNNLDAENTLETKIKRPLMDEPESTSSSCSVGPHLNQEHLDINRPSPAHSSSSSASDHSREEPPRFQCKSHLEKTNMEVQEENLKLRKENLDLREQKLHLRKKKLALREKKLAMKLDPREKKLGRMNVTMARK